MTPYRASGVELERRWMNPAPDMPMTNGPLGGLCALPDWESLRAEPEDVSVYVGCEAFDTPPDRMSPEFQAWFAEQMAFLRERMIDAFQNSSIVATGSEKDHAIVMLHREMLHERYPMVYPARFLPPSQAIVGVSA